MGYQNENLNENLGNPYKRIERFYMFILYRLGSGEQCGNQARKAENGGELGRNAKGLFLFFLD